MTHGGQLWYNVPSRKGEGFMEEKGYFQMYFDLASARSFVSDEGEVVALHPAEKMVYAFMYHRMKMFKDREYFESQQKIAEACGVSRATVVNAINKFREHGVLHSEVKDRDGWMGWDRTSYKVLKPLVLSKQLPPKKKKEEEPIKTPPPVVDIELDGPF